MADVNSVWIEGRVFRDAKEIGDWGMVSFTLTTSSSYKKKDGTMVYDNCYHNCVINGKVRMGGEFQEVPVDHIVDGLRVRVYGSIKQDKVEKDGKKNTYHKIKVDGLDILGMDPEYKPRDDQQEREDFSSAEVRSEKPKAKPRSYTTKFPKGTEEQEAAKRQKQLDAEAKMRAAQDDVNIEDVPF